MNSQRYYDWDVLLLLLVLVACILTGCRPADAFGELSKTAEAQYAVEAVTLLERKDVKALVTRLAPEFQTPSAEAAVARMSTEVVPAEAELSHKLVGYRWNWTNKIRSVTVDLEYRFPSTYMLAEAIVIGSPPNLRLWRFRVQRGPQSLEEQNAFRLGGKPATSYVVLAAAVVVPAFILVVLMICIRTPIRKRKWLWVLYIILGFGKLSVNWTTNAVWVEELAIQLLGSGFRAEGYGPWVISASLPVGAVQFLLRRKKLMRSGNEVLQIGRVTSV